MEVVKEMDKEERGEGVDEEEDDDDLAPLGGAGPGAGAGADGLWGGRLGGGGMRDGVKRRWTVIERGS